MKDLKESLVIYFGEKEVPLSSKTLNRINTNPEAHYVLLEKGSNEKDKYIKNLDELFKHYRSNKEIGYNRYSSIVDSMQNWIQSMPKYTREYAVKFTSIEQVVVSREIINLRKELLKYDINPREFLIDRLKTKILGEKSYEECFRMIKNMKEEIDNHISKFKQMLIITTKESFEKGYKGEIRSVLVNWLNNLKEANKKQLYDSITNNVLRYIAELPTNNEDLIIERMAYLITGLNVEDWNDSSYKNYITELCRIKELVSSYNDEMGVYENKSYEIVLNNGKKKIQNTFASTKISATGSTLFNEVNQIFDDYADSIDENEKRNILMKLLQKYM